MLPAVILPMRCMPGWGGEIIGGIGDALLFFMFRCWGPCCVFRGVEDDGVSLGRQLIGEIHSLQRIDTTVRNLTKIR